MGKIGTNRRTKTQLQEIRRNTREEIDKILTEEQRARLKNAMENRDGKRGGWRSVMNSLNLSDEQKTQIREVKRAQRTKMEAILTDEQKAQPMNTKNKGAIAFNNTDKISNSS